MVLASIVGGMAKVVVPIVVARAAWWLVEDLVLDRLDLPFF